MTSLDERLIELVEAHPFLYEKEVRRTTYETLKKKTAIWKQIGHQLGLDSKTCLLRWKGLREKYLKELEIIRTNNLYTNGNGITTNLWPLMDKMAFLDNAIKYQRVSNNVKSAAQPQITETVTWSEMDAEQLIEEVANDDNDDPLQEAMDDQTLFNTNTIIMATTDNVNNASQESIMRRIETLLEGLNNSNRTKAEKRIVAYLCKCQLKSLSNDDVDDIVI